MWEGRSCPSMVTGAKGRRVGAKQRLDLGRSILKRMRLEECAVHTEAAKCDMRVPRWKGKGRESWGQVHVT
jgi:hypothetical protein